jgi:hypothetical protein
MVEIKSNNNEKDTDIIPVHWGESDE